MRHDGGDAETGFGLDLGSGLTWTDETTGIRAEVSGRGLLTHEAAGIRQRGIAGSFVWKPVQGSDRGPHLTLSQTMGASARGGVDALLNQRTLEGLAANDNGDGLDRRSLELQFGYGFGALDDRFTSTPQLGLGFSERGRELGLTWWLVRDRRSGEIGSLELRVEGWRRDSAHDEASPYYGAGLRITTRF